MTPTRKSQWECSWFGGNKKFLEKHGNHCHDQQKHFSLFPPSADGMLGKEALVLLANLSQLMAAITEELISHVQGWVSGPV